MYQNNDIHSRHMIQSEPHISICESQCTYCILEAVSGSTTKWLCYTTMYADFQGIFSRLLNVKGKVTLYISSLQHYHIRESGNKAPHILNLGIRRQCTVSTVFRPLSAQRKRPGSVRCKSGSGHDSEMRNSCLCWKSIPVISP